MIMYLVPTPLFNHILISPKHEQLMYAMVYIWSTSFVYGALYICIYMKQYIFIWSIAFYVQMGHSIYSFDKQHHCKKEMLFWQLYFSQELQQLTWFMR